MRHLDPNLPDSTCPCDSQQSYASCCQPYHQGLAAPYPLALMRSRYSAFALGLADYLLLSWHPSTRPESLELEADVQWQGLEIHGHGVLQQRGWVEFSAHFAQQGQAGCLREKSQFRKQAGRWYYHSGLIRSQ